jgi:rhodanese-related sulfurtransferase
MSLADLRGYVERGGAELLILDVREREAFERSHIPGARLLPRGQLELRVNEELPDPTRRIIVYCELGQISTLAAATLRDLGFKRVVALDGGMRAWTQAEYPTAAGR